MIIYYWLIEILLHRFPNLSEEHAGTQSKFKAELKNFHDFILNPYNTHATKEHSLQKCNQICVKYHRNIKNKYIKTMHYTKNKHLLIPCK